LQEVLLHDGRLLQGDAGLEKAMKLAPNLPEPYFLMGSPTRTGSGPKRPRISSRVRWRRTSGTFRRISRWAALLRGGGSRQAADVLEDALEIDGKNAEAQMLLE
jgi:hypothetical protein